MQEYVAAANSRTEADYTELRDAFLAKHDPEMKNFVLNNEKVVK